MVLDAPTYKTVVTPEAALGLVQKEIRHKGWKNVEVEDVRLVYTPFYVFGFDVATEGTAPIGGKAALNAYNGDLDELVPMIIERPLTRQSKPEEGAEVEDTSIPAVEAKGVARDKISVQTAVPRDRVSVSAVSKVYIPYYRVWGSVGHDSFRAHVDALMGSVVGLEAIHERPKTWSESTSQTLGKLKSPSGWAELGGKTIGALSGGGDHGGGHGGGHEEHGGGGGSILQRKEVQWVLLIGIILALTYYVFYARGASNVSCTGAISTVGNLCVLNANCGFNNPSSDQTYVTGRLQIFQKGQERTGLGVLIGTLVDAKGTSDQWRKDYDTNWTSEGLNCQNDFSWKVGSI